MTFYQELQLNQSGSKAYISSFKSLKDKIKHTAIYLLKIVLTVAFCVTFVSLFSMLFGSENSIVGVVILLCILVFRFSDLGIQTSHGIAGIFCIFSILAIGPKVSNLVSPIWAFFINFSCILLLMIIGCHNVVLCNYSTFVLSYLLLQGYDVSGNAYKSRLAALFLGAVIIGLLLYCKHRNVTYKRKFKDLFLEFHPSSSRSRWQLRLSLVVSTALLIASALKIPKAMWIGIAAMSVTLPFQDDMIQRVKFRAPGNILGGILFFLLYFLLPENCASYIGIIGGIGVGLSASYGWQAAFNSLSAITVAAPVFGLSHAVFLRIFNNIVGSIYAFLFNGIFEMIYNTILGNRYLIRCR